ncbi:trypsin-1 isoform X2 [Anabrus simplex]
MDNRILRGENASITEFPSMVFLKIGLRRKGVYSLCGGTIISERWILTAAHCVHNAIASNITMRVGSENKLHGGSVRRASRIIEHEEYSFKEDGGKRKKVRNDIALVEAEEPFPLNNLTIKTARLAVRNEDTAPGTIVTVAGWGVIEGNYGTKILQKAELEIIRSQRCGKHDRTKLCAVDSRKEKGICSGDSGGPVFKKGVLVGVTSTGQGNCNLKGSVSTSASVAYFRDWIYQNSGI